MTHDVVYHGNDIDQSRPVVEKNKLSQFPWYEAKECQKLCDKKPECRFWTYDDHMCYFKHSKLGYRNKKGALSGSKCTGPSGETRLRSDLEGKDKKINDQGKRLDDLKTEITEYEKKLLEKNDETENLKNDQNNLKILHNDQISKLEHNHKKELEDAMKKIPLYYLIVGICALVLLFTLVIGNIVYYCWKKHKQTHQKNELGDLKTLSDILRLTTLARKRSYESMDSSRSTRTREMNFQPGRTPTNTNATQYFIAKYPLTEEQKNQMQVLSPSQPPPILSALRGIEYKPNHSDISKFSSPLEHDSNCSKNEKIEENFFSGR
jgi:hypothetical protein